MRVDLRQYFWACFKRTSVITICLELGFVIWYNLSLPQPVSWYAVIFSIGAALVAGPSIGFVLTVMKMEGFRPGSTSGELAPLCEPGRCLLILGMGSLMLSFLALMGLVMGHILIYPETEVYPNLTLAKLGSIALAIGVFLDLILGLLLIKRIEPGHYSYKPRYSDQQPRPVVFPRHTWVTRPYAADLIKK